MYCSWLWLGPAPVARCPLSVPIEHPQQQSLAVSLSLSYSLPLFVFYASLNKRIAAHSQSNNNWKKKKKIPQNNEKCLKIAMYCIRRSSAPLRIPLPHASCCCEWGARQELLFLLPFKAQWRAAHAHHAHALFPVPCLNAFHCCLVPPCPTYCPFYLSHSCTYCFVILSNRHSPESAWQRKICCHSRSVGPIGGRIIKVIATSRSAQASTLSGT